MHSTSTPAVQGTPENQRTAAIGADESARPKSWSYMHRAKWARALPVSPGARLTAVCIADHINGKTGQWNLSSAQIADETGRIGKYADRAVRRHVNDELRAYFYIEDRPGRMWRFTIPAPMMAVVEPRTKCPDRPDKMSDVPCKPSKYVPPPALPEHLTAIEGDHFLKCRRCDHSWPAVTGRAHICVGRSEQPSWTRKDRARPPRDSAVRSRKIDQARREWKRIESVSSQGGEG